MNNPLLSSSPLVYGAVNFARTAHEGQVDKEGKPAIDHALAVMEKVAQVYSVSEELQAIAVLHDVVEDTEITVEDIRYTFGDVIANAVDAISRREGETYLDYIVRCRRDPLAHIVKVADLRINIARCEASGKHENLLKRYRVAIDMLTK